MAVGFCFLSKRNEKNKIRFFYFFFFSQKNTLGRNSLSAYWLILIKKVCFKKPPQQSLTNSNYILSIIMGKILQKEWLKRYKGHLKPEATWPNTYVAFRYGRKQTKATCTLINKMSHGLFFTPEIRWHNLVRISSLLQEGGLTESCNQSRLPHLPPELVLAAPAAPPLTPRAIRSVGGRECKWSRLPPYSHAMALLSFLAEM